MGGKVIVDCDPGIDDALALLAVCGAPDVELLGVTTVAGNLPLPAVTDNASGLLAAAGSPALVYPGCASGLYRLAKTADHGHGQGGLGDWQVQPAPQLVSCRHAVDFIAEQLAAYPGEVTIIALGPLTNIAMACQHHPRVMAGLANLVLMGGALAKPGNITPAAEFNIYIDPEAAEIVLNSGLPLTMVSLDVTEAVLLDARDHDRLKTTGRLGASLAAMVGYYLKGFGKMPLHDPLAVMVALDPGAFSYRKAAVQVETRGELNLGRTVVDQGGRHGWPENVRLVVEVEGGLCKARLFSYWARC